MKNNNYIFTIALLAFMTPINIVIADYNNLAGHILEFLFFMYGMLALVAIPIIVAMRSELSELMEGLNPISYVISKRKVVNINKTGKAELLISAGMNIIVFVLYSIIIYFAFHLAR